MTRAREYWPIDRNEPDAIEIPMSDAQREALQSDLTGD